MPEGDDLNDGLEYDAFYNSNTEELDESSISIKLHNDAYKKGLENEEDDIDVKPLSKRQKKLAGSKFHQKKVERMEYEKEFKINLPKCSTDRIVEYLATLIRTKNPELSGLELNELYFKKSDFISTETFNKKRDLDNLQSFINNFSKAPQSIILSTSNIRVADVFRHLGGYNNCVKLFSKNKLVDDVAKLEDLLSHRRLEKNNKGLKISKKTKNKEVQHNTIKYFISTPVRLFKIIKQTDILFQSKEKLDIFLDASFLDSKMNTILTSEDNMTLFNMLNEFLKKKSSVKIMLF